MNLTGAPALARRDAFADCAAATRLLLREREQRYPELVAAARLTAEDAERSLALARALVAQWAWVIDPAAPPLPPGDPFDFGQPFVRMRADTQIVAERARKRAAASPDNDHLAHLAALYEAVAWWQEPSPHCSFVARIVMALDIERSSPCIGVGA